MIRSVPDISEMSGDGGAAGRGPRRSVAEGGAARCSRGWWGRSVAEGAAAPCFRWWWVRSVAAADRRHPARRQPGSAVAGGLDGVQLGVLSIVEHELVVGTELDQAGAVE